MRHKTFQQVARSRLCYEVAMKAHDVMASHGKSPEWVIERIGDEGATVVDRVLNARGNMRLEDIADFFLAFGLTPHIVLERLLTTPTPTTPDEGARDEM